MIHTWEENGEWYWDDAEDHGGFDRNVPCGPFLSRDATIADAAEVFGPDVLVQDGKPGRYDDGMS
jgi:hypothetical protein